MVCDGAALVIDVLVLCLDCFFSRLFAWFLFISLFCFCCVFVLFDAWRIRCMQSVWEGRLGHFLCNHTEIQVAG